MGLSWHVCGPHDMNMLVVMMTTSRLIMTISPDLLRSHVMVMTKLMVMVTLTTTTLTMTISPAPLAST